MTLVHTVHGYPVNVFSCILLTSERQLNWIVVTDCLCLEREDYYTCGDGDGAVY